MLFKLKESPFFYVRFKESGKVLQFSTKTANRREAQKMHDDYKMKLLKNKQGISDPAAVPTLNEFIPKFIEHVSTLKEKTGTSYLQRLNCITRSGILGNLKLDRIGGEQITKFLMWSKAEGYKVSTTNRALATLRKLVRLSADYNNHAAKPIRLKSGENMRHRVISIEEEIVYLAAAAPLLRDVATLVLDMAMRPGEIYNLTPDQVQGDFIVIRDGKTANAARRLEMTDRVKEIVTRRLTAKGRYLFPLPSYHKQPMNQSSIRKQHATALINSGVDPFVLYELRHTCLTRLANTGIPASALAAFAGHSDAAITLRRYVRLSAVDVAKHIKKSRDETLVKK